MTGVILAGGENLRMSVPKAFLNIGGERLIERNLSILKRVFEDTAIVTNKPELYIYLGVPMFGDVYRIRGPMTGVFTALINSHYPWVFVSACDMPFLKEELIMYMVDIAKTADGFDAIVPLSGDTMEPLFAMYSKRLIKDMEGFLLKGGRSLCRFLEGERIHPLSEEDVKRFDPDGKSFVNLNTPEDFLREIGGRICLV